MMQKPHAHLVPAALIFLFFTSNVNACLWDYDTLRDEKRGMPGIAEVLAGQWERHSQFFYENRVEKMKTLLANKPDDQDAMDNLAVAYFKLGKSDDAIRAMLEKEKRHPGQYTTSSNLGTFYMLNGRMDEAIDCLQKALEINPKAHFGREEYQLLLAQYLQKAKSQPEMLDHSFIYTLYEPFTPTTGPTTESTDQEAARAEEFEINRNIGFTSKLESVGFKPNIIEGVVGMLRFGTDQSPDLYFALGDLLALHRDKNLAVRAYRRALDLHYSHADAIKTAIDQVQELVVPRGGLDPAIIAAERVDGQRWVADYQQFEDDLVRSGKDTDDESNYAAFYAIHGRTLKTNDIFIGDYANQGVLQKWPVTTIAVITIFATSVVLGMRQLLKTLKIKFNLH